MRADSTRSISSAIPEFPVAFALNNSRLAPANLATHDAGAKAIPSAKGVTSPKRGGPRPQPRAGFLLLNASLRPLSFNGEAVQILGYPEEPAIKGRPGIFLVRKIRSSLMGHQASRELPFVTEFRSGKRRYLCRAFVVDAPAKGQLHPTIALLLERDPCGLMALSNVCEQFHLTPREGEALEHLVQGLSSKEIADRMQVSPNTVKNFLRMIMVRMGVSSRTAIMARITMTSRS